MLEAETLHQLAKRLEDAFVKLHDALKLGSHSTIRAAARDMARLTEIIAHRTREL